MFLIFQYVRLNFVAKIVLYTIHSGKNLLNPVGGQFGSICKHFNVWKLLAKVILIFHTLSSVLPHILLDAAM